MNRIGSALVLAVATAGAVMAFAVVAARTLEQGEVRLAEAQLDFLLSDTAQIIERNLQLGLPLEELQQVPPVLEELSGASPFIVAADVFSVAGVTVFSTDRGAVGEPVPPAWIEAMAAARDPAAGWAADEGPTVTLGTPVANDFGRIEGWLSVIVEREALAAPLSRVPGAALAALPFAALGGLIAGLAGWVLVPRIDRDLAGARTALAERVATPARNTALDDAVERAIARTREAEASIATAQEEMVRLDAKV